jgi:hypothetical protein
MEGRASDQKTMARIFGADLSKNPGQLRRLTLAGVVLRGETAESKNKKTMKFRKKK